MSFDVELKGRREVKPHWFMSIAMLHFYETAENNITGSLYSVMACIIFTAFRFESYINYVGEKGIENWNKHERKSIYKKYKFICNNYGVGVEESSSQYKTFEEVFNFRNSLAHGRPEIMTHEDIVDIDYEIPYEILNSEWENYCTLENAKKAMTDIEILISELDDKIGDVSYLFSGEHTKWSKTWESKK